MQLFWVLFFWAVRVYLDGEEQKSINTNSAFAPTVYEYDITGVKQIKIGIEQNYNVRATYALTDIVFTK